MLCHERCARANNNDATTRNHDHLANNEQHRNQTDGRNCARGCCLISRVRASTKLPESTPSVSRDENVRALGALRLTAKQRNLKTYAYESMGELYCVHCFLRVDREAYLALGARYNIVDPIKSATTTKKKRSHSDVDSDNDSSSTLSSSSLNKRSNISNNSLLEFEQGAHL